MHKINLINDDIYKLFWKIALPSSIGTIFQNLYSIVDAIFAGRMISETALAAIGQTSIYFIIIALGIGLSNYKVVANSIENNFKKAVVFLSITGLSYYSWRHHFNFRNKIWTYYIRVN